MTATILFPTVLKGETLYRCLYKSYALDCQWAYAFDLQHQRVRYEALVVLAATTPCLLRRIEQEELPRLLAWTDLALHHLRASNDDWIPVATGARRSLQRRKTLDARIAEPIGETVSTIIKELPRLHDVRMTAYYR